MQSIFDLCTPRTEVLQGELREDIFAARLQDVMNGKADPVYGDPATFFDNTYPIAGLKTLLADALGRLIGKAVGKNAVIRLETAFGGGKTHNLIAAVHLAREGSNLASLLADYQVNRLPSPGIAKIAAFVCDQSDPQTGLLHRENNAEFRTYISWGEIAYQIGGLTAFEQIRANDEYGGAPSRQALERILGQDPVLILIDDPVHTGRVPQALAALRNGVLNAIRRTGWKNVAAALRHFEASAVEALTLPGVGVS